MLMEYYPSPVECCASQWQRGGRRRWGSGAWRGNECDDIFLPCYNNMISQLVQYPPQPNKVLLTKLNGGKKTSYVDLYKHELRTLLSAVKNRDKLAYFWFLLDKLCIEFFFVIIKYDLAKSYHDFVRLRGIGGKQRTLGRGFSRESRGAKFYVRIGRQKK
jgi:hypothetical protein